MYTYITALFHQEDRFEQIQVVLFKCLYQARGMRGIDLTSVYMNSDRILDGVVFFFKIAFSCSE